MTLDSVLGLRPTTETPWDRLGRKFDLPTTPAQAVQKAGLDYQIIKAPCMASVPDDPDGLQIAITGKRALLRMPTPDDPYHRDLSIVGERYDFLQNKEIGDMLSAFTQWPCEVAGDYGYGLVVFFALHIGEESIGGVDPIREYFLFHDARTGSGAQRLSYVPVHTATGVAMVFKGASTRVGLTHSAIIGADTSAMVQFFNRIQGIRRDGLATLQRLAEFRLSDPEAEAIIAKAYPIRPCPKKVMLADDAANLSEANGEEAVVVNAADGTEGASFTDTAAKMRAVWENERDREIALRESIFGAWQAMREEIPALAGSAWALLRTIGSHEDFGRKSRDPKGSAADSLWGGRAERKCRAFDAATAAMKARK